MISVKLICVIVSILVQGFSHDLISVHFSSLVIVSFPHSHQIIIAIIKSNCILFRQV